MKAVVQRVLRASVHVQHRRIAEISQGLLLLVGVAKGDTEQDAAYLAAKIAGLRIFEEPPGKMNLSVRDVRGEILAVPQFTLLADCRRGRRPDFAQAELPEAGAALFAEFVRALKAEGVPVSQGTFREHMEVELVNDGPVTLLLDSKKSGSPDPSE